MSKQKQIRINESGYECLGRLATKTGKSRSLCATLVLEMFEQLFDKLDDDGTLCVKRGSETSELIMPFRQRPDE